MAKAKGNRGNKLVPVLNYNAQDGITTPPVLTGAKFKTYHK